MALRQLLRVSLLRNLQCRYIRSNKNLVAKDASEDILLDNLKSATSSHALLDEVNNHRTIMNANHVVQALRSLFILQKYNQDQNLQEIQPKLEPLCNILKKRLTELEVNEIIESLKVLSFIGIPLHSKISQALLQMIRTQINELTLQQIVFLQFLLTKQTENKRSPLVDALQIALPLIIDNNLKTKIDSDNVSLLCDLLQFAAKYQLSQKSIFLIIDALLPHHLSVQQAKSIMWSLCDLQPNRKYSDLLDKCFDILSRGIQNLRVAEIDTIISKVVQRVGRNTMFYYNESFIDNVCMTLIDRQVSLNSAVGTLSRITQMEHVNLPLIAYVTKIFLSDPSLFLSTQPVILRAYIKSIAKANYTELNGLDEIKNLVHLTGDSIKGGVVFAVEMATLGLYPRHILESVLDLGYLQRIIHKGRYSQNLNILVLIEAIKYLSKDNIDLIPEDSLIQNAMGNIETKDIEFSLRGALETALGGSNYVATNINANFGYVIDHAIIRRKGGFPVALNTTNQQTWSIDEIEELAQDNQIIAVMVFPASCYAINVDRLKGVYSLMIDILRARGITVIPIGLYQFHQLLDHEKIPYLMQKIRLCTETTAINDMKNPI